MTGGSAEKAIDQLLAAINQGKDSPRRYQPGVTLGFPDLDVFTPEALERIKTLAGGDPARAAWLSAHVLKIAQRECAVPVLPDLVDDAAAQIDLERADLKADSARLEPDHEHSAPRADIRLKGVPPPGPSAGPRHDPAPQAGRAEPGVSPSRRRMRRAVGVLGVLLLAAAGVAGYLAYSGRLDTLGLDDPREILTSGLAAIGVVPPEQQEGGSGNNEASLPAERAAESELPAISRPGLHEQPDAPLASPPVAAVPLEDLTVADPVAAESGLQPQSEPPRSDKVDDRQQQIALTTERFADKAGADPGEVSGEITDENFDMVVVAPGQTLESLQDEVSESMAAPMTSAPQWVELLENNEKAAPLAGQPLPPTMPSSPAEPGAADGAAETAAPVAAKAATAPEVTPAADSPPAATPPGQDVADLVDRGNALLDLGDLASARLFYQLAANRGSPEGAMLMGMTFDPVYFARAGIRGTQPQIQDALHWYDKAIAMGSRSAERRMGELRSWLERSAAAGDAQAKAALEQLR